MDRLSKQIKFSPIGGGTHVLRQSRKGYLLLLTAFRACTCHLPLTLALLGGTTVGLYLTENLLWPVPLLAIYFVWALFKGFKMLR